MHPGQRRRLKHEEANRTGGPLDVSRYGCKIATLTRSDGTQWTATMLDGRTLPANLTVDGAERDAIVQAKHDERGVAR